MDRPAGPGPGSALTALAATPDGVRLKLRVQPRASRTELAGLHGDEIRIRIAAPPVDGAANEALVRFLAERLGVARSAVRVTSGAGSRSKTVIVSGVSRDQAAQQLGLGQPTDPPVRAGRGRP
jgi:uncharacterized protein (TIGR00251 family)